MASVPRPAGTPHTSGAHPDIHAHRILILDFGAQYTQLIARRVRELGVYCEIHPWDVSDAEVRGFRARGVILSGGPESVTDADPPRAPPAVYELGVPVLGICYGMQTMAQQLGGRVTPGVEREFGYAEVTVTGASRLLDHLQDRRNPAGAAVLDVWMSHGDRVDALPQGFVATASTGTIAFAAMADERRRFYGVQFHPEVTHTPQGARLLERFVRVDAQPRFLTALAGVTDPEAKRKIIGRTFVDVFDEQAQRLSGVQFLAQGTIYPDVIESAGARTGKAQVIKSHHNVGGLPAKMHLQLVEPLRELFKDEVRRLGIELGLPREMVYRHPFPGPGLGVRILGEVRSEYAELLRRADAIYIEELRKHDLYDRVSQAFAVFLPVRSVGVMGDGRRYDYVIALRAVETVDFMTAHWARLPYEFLDHVSRRIVNEVPGISRVVYDISGKPPATIEWE